MLNLPTTLVFAGDSEGHTRLMVRRTKMGLDLRVDASVPNRLMLDRLPVSAARLGLVGPTARALWEMLLPDGRPVRSVGGVTVSYSADDQVLALLVETGADLIVVQDDQQVLRVEIQLAGPGAMMIWASLIQAPPGDEDPFEGFEPTRVS